MQTSRCRIFESASQPIHIQLCLTWIFPPSFCLPKLQQGNTNTIIQEIPDFSTHALHTAKATVMWRLYVYQVHPSSLKISLQDLCFIVFGSVQMRSNRYQMVFLFKVCEGQLRDTQATTNVTILSTSPFNQVDKRDSHGPRPRNLYQFVLLNFGKSTWLKVFLQTLVWHVRWKFPTNLHIPLLLGVDTSQSMNPNDP